MRPPPSYIQKSGTLDITGKLSWKGAGMHFGPDQGTKLHVALGKLTVCAHATVCALVEEWLIWRLHDSIDVERFLSHVDSVLAWEIDPRYRDVHLLKLPETTPTNQAIGDGVWMVQRATSDENWHSPAVADDKSAALVSVVRQVLPAAQKRAFNHWLDFALSRAAKLDPRPRKVRPKWDDFPDKQSFREALQPYLGRPLPREALEPGEDYNPEQREKYFSRFLEGVNWKKNPFLRSPTEMKKLGFKGTPYELRSGGL